jgi:hypothetical protein
MSEEEIKFIKARIVELKVYQEKGIREIGFPFDRTFSIEVMLGIFKKILDKDDK